MKKFSMEELLPLLQNVHYRGSQVVAECPACGDDHHLYVNEKDGVALIYCFKCQAPQRELWQAIRENNIELFDWKSPKHIVHRPKPITGYPHRKTATEEHGKLIEDISYAYRGPDNSIEYIKTRRKYEDGHKIFFFSYTNEEGREIMRKPENCDTLYNLEILERAKPKRTLYVVEGEKCADKMLSNDFLSTTSNTGAQNTINLSSTDAYYLDKFPNKVVIPDNDEPGMRYAMFWVSKGCKLLNLPDIWPECPPKGDVADYFEQGGDPSKIENYDFDAKLKEVHVDASSGK